MFPEQLKKILKMIKQTHDRVVIFDGNSPEDSYVIMDLDNYMDQSAQSVQSVQRAPEAKRPLAPAKEIAQENSELSPKSGKNENLTEEDLTDKINREISMWKNQENPPYIAEENRAKQAWQIPPVVKDKAQEVE